MDGNGRWANERGWRRIQGHVEGANRVISIVEEAIRLQVKTLSLFCFSTENWKRPPEEIDFLMGLMRTFIRQQSHRLHKNRVCVRVLGEVHKAPLELQEGLAETVRLTCENTGMNLNFMVSYGGRHDILRATKKIALAVKNGELDLADIDEKTFSEQLYTHELEDPDLLIRTSGEFRLSNFMLWQSAYAEVYVTDKLWPDFTPKDLEAACLHFARRDRRFGAACDLIKAEGQ